LLGKKIKIQPQTWGRRLRVKYVNRFKVAPGGKVKLKDIDSRFKDHHESHKDAAEEIEQDRKKLRELQELLYADRRCSLLICLQGMDTGGRTGRLATSWER
jgi:polyphosphate kinase 2 (PPK2 family)